MGELYGIIQKHLDRYGVREAALARLMGTSSQTINSWKTRGVRQLPTRTLLEAVARETGTSYDVVLHAALVDAGYAAPLTPEARATPALSTEGERSAPHATTVTESDIAAGAMLPRAVPRQRRRTPSSDTRPRRHTS